MSQAADLFVYADLNCPFCHALNEHLNSLGTAAQVEWRPIQHDPTAQSRVRGLDLLNELTAEVTEVRKRAPGVAVVSPGFRPNSGPAGEAIVEAARVDADKACRLRTALYRALWAEGRDISDPALIAKLARSVGLPPLDVSDPTRQALARWQREWADGDFDRQIPVSRCGDGRTLIGFPDLGRIHAFFQAGETLDEARSFPSCVMKPRHGVLVLDRDAEMVETVAEQLKDHDVIICADASSLYCKLSSQPTDLIIVNVDSLGVDPERFCARLRDDERARDVPLILTGRGDTPEVEVRAFEAGAADFIATPCHPTVFRARCATQLRVRRSLELLESMARLDGLTGLYNRRELDRVLEAEWRRALRAGECVALVLLDIDEFKRLNDHYGHARGDQCLKTVARVLQAGLGRPSDLAARYGGEEFALLLPNTSGSGAAAVAERVRAQVASLGMPHEASQRHPVVTISAGVAAMVPIPQAAPELLLQVADQALYRAKERGRNRVCSGDAGGA